MTKLIYVRIQKSDKQKSIGPAIANTMIAPRAIQPTIILKKEYKRRIRFW
ncbi:hypothetical protein GMB86_06770 [Terrilactibacillus sp. BCM23-1]|uniref:Uncharacterized protein n=1 Tax=Terrilactibacillus tamarindi TaxID=2599694 RepID=A0A6N8CNJ7_9BACI|nr:hypothetical protein [Terrilactibacillus tamarindi]MTT31714.1 hypothetical protein [Terrilactibacillus tamarindi]